MGFQATVVQKKLEEVGFDAKLAYGLTAVLERDVVGHLEERLVTKDHFDAALSSLESRFETRIGEIKVELAEFKAETDSRFASLESSVDSRFASLESSVSSRFASLESSVSSRFASLEGNVDSRFAALDAKIDTRISELKAEMIKWMIGLTGGSTLAIILTLLRLVK